jgi:hypothetical protein
MPRNPHGASIPPGEAPRPNLSVRANAAPLDGGRRVPAALAAAEGLTEALAAFDSELDALAEWVGILRLVGEQIIARRQRLEAVVVPEVARGYRAAEAVVDIERARKKYRGRIVPAARVAAIARAA